MKKTTIYIVMAMLCFFLRMQGQVRYTLKGSVIDQNEQPIANVSIKIGTNHLATTSNNEGQFIIHTTLPKGILTFTSVGYKPAQLAFEGNTSNLKMILIEDAASLQEVAVLSTGYQTLPKERATGAFSTIDKQKFDRQVGSDVIARLKGIVAGLAVDERNGQMKLSIRGRSTIFANDQPLIVLDGFPYEGDLNNLNPNDIENITILKDAAAASIWGVKAGNGVIVITTKLPTASTQLKIETNTNFTLSDRPDLYAQPQISSSDFITAEQRWFTLGLFDADLNNNTSYVPVTPVISLLNKHRSAQISTTALNEALASLAQTDLRSDLLRYIYQKALQQQYAVAFSGRYKKYSYRFTTGADIGNRPIRASAQQRIYINAKQQLDLSDRLQLNLQTQWIMGRNNLQNILGNLNMAGPNGRAMYPYAKLADNNGIALSLIKEYTDEYKAQQETKGYLDWAYRPLDELQLNNHKRTQNEIRLNAGLAYQCLPFLKAALTYQFENQWSNTENLQHADSYYVRNLINRYTTPSTLQKNVPLGSIFDSSHASLLRQSVRAQLYFDQSFNRHQINAIFGAEAREITNNTLANRYYGYDENLTATTTVNYRTAYTLAPEGVGLIPNIDNLGGLVERYRSFFANTAYTYQGQYIFSASARIDQSNLFGVNANQKSVPLWSVGAKWLLDRAGFYRVDHILPQLALSLSYGYNGNLDRAVTAFTTAGFSTSVTTGQPAATIYTPPNPNLQWERVGIFNVGLDFSFRKAIINGTLAYYRKNAKDLMGYATLDPTYGLSSYRGNVAGMATQGLELTLNFRPIQRKLNWQATVWMTHVADKVTNYKASTNLAAYFADASLEGNVIDLFAPTVGKPLFGVYSRKWAGLNPENGNPRGYHNGMLSEDYAQLISPIGKTVDSLVYHGPAQAPSFGSISNSFSYRNFTIAFNISYKLGYYFRANSINYSALYSRGVGHSDFAMRWQKNGDEQHTNVPSFSDQINANRDSFYATSEILVHRGDHVRFQDLSLNYLFNLHKRSKDSFTHLNIYAYINNLGILWRANKKDIDPDYPLQALPKTYALGLKLSF